MSFGATGKRRRRQQSVKRRRTSSATPHNQMARARHRYCEQLGHAAAGTHNGDNSFSLVSISSVKSTEVRPPSLVDITRPSTS